MSCLFSSLSLSSGLRNLQGENFPSKDFLVLKLTKSFQNNKKKSEIEFFSPLPSVDATWDEGKKERHLNAKFVFLLTCPSSLTCSKCARNDDFEVTKQEEAKKKGSHVNAVLKRTNFVLLTRPVLKATGEVLTSSRRMTWDVSGVVETWKQDVLSIFRNSIY